MKAIIYKGAKDIEVKDVDMKEAKQKEGLIQIKCAGICGSDLGIYGGTHPRAKAPLVMGHEFSGVLMNDTKSLKKGARVTVNPLVSCGECTPCKTGNSHVCNSLKLLGIDFDGGMAEYAVVSEDKIVPIDDEVSFELGCFIEPVAVAVHTLRETGYVSGDNALIYGCGTIGLVMAQTLIEYGCPSVTLIEADDVRADKARSLGFEVYDAKTLDIDNLKQLKTNGDGFDFVYDCAGVPAVASQLIEMVKVRGKIIVVASYKKAAEVPLIQGMFKETSISFVRVYRDKDFLLASLLVKNQPKYREFITHVLPLDDAQAGFDLLLNAGTGAIKVIYKF